jgi:cell division septation protein DedD
MSPEVLPIALPDSPLGATIGILDMLRHVLEQLVTIRPAVARKAVLRGFHTQRVTHRDTGDPAHRKPKHRKPKHRKPKHRKPKHRKPKHLNPKHRKPENLQSKTTQAQSTHGIHTNHRKKYRS